MQNNPDRWGLILLILLVLVITSVPYACGWSSAVSNGWEFSGFVFGVEDGNSYIAKMLRGAVGDWLFKTPYTNVPQAGVYLFFLPYLLLGKLAGNPPDHTTLVILFHIFRLFSATLVTWAMYDFTGILISLKQYRLVTTAMVSLGGGLGWLALISGQNDFSALPLEFYSPEAFGFLAIFGIPHLALARALMLWVMIGMLSSVSQENWSGWLPKGRAGWLRVIKYGAVSLGVVLAQPINAYILWLSLGVFGLLLVSLEKMKVSLNWIKGNQTFKLYLKNYIGFSLLSLPALTYLMIKILTDPFIKNWSQMNVLPNAPIYKYVLSYGVLFPLIVGAVILVVKLKHSSGLFLVSWLCLIPVMILLPISVQRRFSEGLWVILAMLLMFVLVNWIEEGRLKKKWLTCFTIFFVAPVILIMGSILNVLQPKVPLFQPTAKITAFKFLAEHAQNRDIVLAAYETSNALPAWAPVLVIDGHGSESISWPENRQLIEAFYMVNTDDAARMQYVSQQGVKWIFWGPEERELGDWNPATASFLINRYDQLGYMIYEVDLENN